MWLEVLVTAIQMHPLKKNAMIMEVGVRRRLCLIV
jgi:hypothetical protein